MKKLYNLPNFANQNMFCRIMFIFFGILAQSTNAETVPSFPAPTMVDEAKPSTRMSPLEVLPSDDRLNDPQALNAVRTLIQGGIPVGQSKTQIVDGVDPISQYSGSPTSGMMISINDSYRYIVKKGDTLNGIIKSTFNQHPVKMKAIREVIIANNKRAFPNGKPSSMLAGATIIIPSLSQMGLQNTSNNNNSAMVQRKNPYISTDPHKGWVRFP
ncbi:hypothetical protein N9V13_05825 [Betaproteobacteria bacterium]|nr:hypothetical protein [Betaproteobacteria bacterium]